ncbi:MAG: hypothetical protein R3282_10765, partial [Rhodothermales bacterium]|nr:hypothetical protein [Rhodothermales bacterium]
MKSHVLLLAALLGAAGLAAPSNAYADGAILTVTAGACDAEVKASLSGVSSATEVVFLLAEVGSHVIDEAARGMVGDDGRLEVQFLLDGSYAVDGECRPGQPYALTAGDLSNKGGLGEPIAQVFFTVGADGQVLLPASTGGGVNV